MTDETIMNRNSLTGVVAMAAMAGGLSALMYLTVAAGGMAAVALGYVAPLPLFAVGLWSGATAAGLAGMIGAILVVLGTGSDIAPLTFIATAAFPAALISAAALRESASGAEGEGQAWGDPGGVLMALFVSAAVGFVLASLLAAGQPGGLEGVLGRALDTILAQLDELGQTPGGVTRMGGEASWMTPALPGLIAVSWMLMSVVNGALAQGALTRFGLNRRPGMRLAELALPRWVPAAFGGCLAVGVLAPDPFGFWAVNLALMLAFALAFAGLAVVHAFAEGRSARPALLVAFYVFLFIFGWPIALLVGLGVIETWTGLSRRLRARRSDRED